MDEGGDKRNSIDGESGLIDRRVRVHRGEFLIGRYLLIARAAPYLPSARGGNFS